MSKEKILIFYEDYAEKYEYFIFNCMFARKPHFSKNRLSQIDDLNVSVSSIFIFVSDRRTIQGHNHKNQWIRGFCGWKLHFLSWKIIKCPFGPQAHTLSPRKSELECQNFLKIGIQICNGLSEKDVSSRSDDF